MKIRIDKEADACYIRINNGKYAHSDEISDGVIIDYDSDGEVLGIEILKTPEIEYIGRE